MGTVVGIDPKFNEKIASKIIALETNNIICSEHFPLLKIEAKFIEYQIVYLLNSEKQYRNNY